MQPTRTEAKPTEGTIWVRLIQPEEGNLAEEAARAILSLKFSDDDKRRMLDLADRNNEGMLSEVEREELENYVKVGDVVSFLHLKAKKSLKKRRLRPSVTR
jgi:hypothetical protein